jgi:hypothetical protein
MLRSSSLPRSGLLLSTFLPRFPSAPFALTQFSTALLVRDRYYRDSDSCQRSPRRQVSPFASCDLPVVPSSTTWYATAPLCPPRQRAVLLPGFATLVQARRHTPPKQVRQPTDRQFASGYSPPRLTTTQLPSATELWLTPAGTRTPRIARHHGRTLNRSRGRGYGLTREVRERPVTRLYVGE